MSIQPPTGQGPVDPRGAFSVPPGPGGPVPPTGGFGPPRMPPGYPPMGMYPLPMFYPPPPPRRSFARAIFTTLATTVLGLSLVANVYLLAMMGLTGGSERQTTVVEGDVKEKIVAIPVNGLISESAYQKLDRMLKQAEKDPDVKGIVLEIDSPGGAVTAADEMYHRVLQFKREHAGVPVVVSQGGLAASGGYYLSCAADYIYAQPTTLTADIGVIMPSFNVSKLFEKWGIDETTVVSQGATFKNAGSMFKPENPADTQYIQSLADKAFVQFKAAVSAGRGAKLMQPIDVIANGKAYMGDEAKALGLVDAVGYPQDAYAYIATLKGLKKQMVVRYQDPASFMDLFTSRLGLNSPKAVSMGGVNVNVDRETLQDALSPRLMYLWRGR